MAIKDKYSEEAYARRVKQANEYRKKTLKRYRFDLNMNNQLDMIEFLDSKENVAGYIKDLIAKDMKKGKRKV